MNRIGNLIVPNSNYCSFEDWVLPILDAMVVDQETKGVRWTPSKVIARLGEEIGKLPGGETSVYYWAWKVRPPLRGFLSLFSLAPS